MFFLCIFLSPNLKQKIEIMKKAKKIFLIFLLVLFIGFCIEVVLYFLGIISLNQLLWPLKVE